MIDLSAFSQKPGESWADIMDEEEEENDRSRHPPADEKKQDPTPAQNTKPIEKPKSSGIVWNIPSEEKKKEQRQFLESLIERRKNIDSLDNWRRKDDNDEKASWRSNKKYREPEKNNASGWHAYSQVLQDEYVQEREDARQEFIRRFGSAPGEESPGEGSPSPPPPPVKPVVISVSAAGPSDWADDLPSDEEHPDYVSDRSSEELDLLVQSVAAIEPLAPESALPEIESPEPGPESPELTSPEPALPEPAASPTKAAEIAQNEEKALEQTEKRELQQEVSAPEERKQDMAQSTVSSSDGWRTGGSADAAPITPLSHSQDDTTVKVEAWRTQVATTPNAWIGFAAQHSQPRMVVHDDKAPHHSHSERTSDAISEHGGHAAALPTDSAPPEQRLSQSERTAQRPPAISPRIQILNHLFKNKTPRPVDTTEISKDGAQRWTAYAAQHTKSADDAHSHSSKVSDAKEDHGRRAATTWNTKSDDAHSHSSRVSGAKEDHGGRAAASWTTRNDDTHSHSSRVSAAKDDHGWRAAASWTTRNDDAHSHSSKISDVKEDHGWRATATWTTNNDDALSQTSRTSHGKPSNTLDDDAKSYSSRISDVKSECLLPPRNDGCASPAWSAFSSNHSARGHGNRRELSPARITVDNTDKSHGNTPDCKAKENNDSWRAAPAWTTSWNNSPSSLETNQATNPSSTAHQTTNGKQTISTPRVNAVTSETATADQVPRPSRAMDAERKVSGESRWQAYAKEHSARINSATSPNNKPWS